VQVDDGLAHRRSFFGELPERGADEDPYAPIGRIKRAAL
jgi:hypothetical protein